MVLWGRSVLAAKRFHQGSTKVAQVSWSLWSSGADPSWAAKKFCGRFHLFFCSFFLNSVSFGVFSHSTGLGGKMKRLSSWGITLRQVAFASQKVLWSVPQTVFSMCLTVSCHFFGQMAVASEKVLWRVPPLHLSLSVLLGVQSCVNCSHVSPIQIQFAENYPSCRCGWGISSIKTHRRANLQQQRKLMSAVAQLLHCFASALGDSKTAQPGSFDTTRSMSKSQCFKRNLRCQFAGVFVGVLWISKESAAQDLRECPPEAVIQMFRRKGAMRAICQVQKRVLGRGDLNSATALVIMNHWGHLRSSWVIFNFGVTHPYISTPHLCNVICICIYMYMLRILRSLVYSACMYFKLNVCLEKRSLSSTSFKKSNSGPKSICSRAGREPQSKNEISITKAGGKVRWKSFDLQVQHESNESFDSFRSFNFSTYPGSYPRRTCGGPTQWKGVGSAQAVNVIRWSPWSAPMRGQDLWVYPAAVATVVDLFLKGWDSHG